MRVIRMTHSRTVGTRFEFWLKGNDIRHDPDNHTTRTKYHKRHHINDYRTCAFVHEFVTSLVFVPRRVFVGAEQAGTACFGEASIVTNGKCPGTVL